MIELGVNIDHVATLRQARRTYEPDPLSLQAIDAICQQIDPIPIVVEVL